MAMCSLRGMRGFVAADAGNAGRESRSAWITVRSAMSREIYGCVGLSGGAGRTRTRNQTVIAETTLPTTLAADDSGGGLSTKITFERVIVFLTDIARSRA